MKAVRFWGKLVCRRLCLVPTWRGWVLILVAGTTLSVLTVRHLHSFLAVSDPFPGGALVVEGWAPDYALAEAISEFKRDHYRKLFVTGVPLDQGSPLSEHKTYADLGAAILIRMGLPPDVVQAVPAPRVRQDRTYTSALALKHWCLEHGAMPTNINLMSLGAHSRRSRLLFAKAFRGAARVGIMAVEDQEYDAKRWWNSSQGVRLVIGEMLAYGYARFWFAPP
jgi:hypothetical protein